MRLNINIPTKGRPGKLLNCLKSIDFSGDYLVTLFCYDQEKDIQDIPDHIPYEIFENKHILTIASHNRVCKQKGHFMGLSDDIEFLPGALDAAVRKLEGMDIEGFGIVDFKVVNMDAPDGCYMMISDSFINAFPDRTPYCPLYKFMFASAELRDYAKSIGRFFKCEGAELNHYHPAVTGKPDSTHKRIRSKGIIENDSEIYHQRKKSGELWTHYRKRSQ